MEMEDYILYTCVQCKTKIANYESIVDHFEQFHSNESNVKDEEWYEILTEYLKDHTDKGCGSCKQKSSFRHRDMWNHLIINHNRYYGILEIYKCKICDIEFAKKENLENHFLIIHGKSGHKSEGYLKNITIRSCGLCGEDFTDGKLLEGHLTNDYKLKKSDIENYRKIVTYRHQLFSNCGLCGEDFTDRKLLKDHLTNDHKLKKSDIEHYGKIITHRDRLISTHKELTTLNSTIANEKESNDTIKKVMKNVTTNAPSNNETIEISAIEDELAKYRNQSHAADNTIAKDTPIECYLCEGKFTDEKFAIEHKKIFHRNIKKCHLCKGEFTDKKSVVEHKKIFHRNIKKCELCGKEFTSWKSIEDHFTNYHGLEKSDIENYKTCKTTKKGPTAPINIKVHLKMHRNCPKVTDTISSLNNEKIAINNEDNIEKSDLEISENYKYSKQSQEADNTVTYLTDHSNILQSGASEIINIPNEYPCDKCNISFSDTGSLEMHKMSETGKQKQEADHSVKPKEAITEIENRSQSQEANNIIAKNTSIECQEGSNLKTSENPVKNSEFGKTSEIDNINNKEDTPHEVGDNTETYTDADNIEEETIDENTAKDILKIMTINAIFSTSTEEKIPDPTTAPRTLFNPTTRSIKDNHKDIDEVKHKDKGVEVTDKITHNSTIPIKETFENHSQVLEENINKVLQFEKGITSSRSELSKLKSEMKEVTNSLKSMEAALTDKSDYNKSLSEKRGNISKTKIILGEDIPQNNVTKQSKQTSGSFCTELKEVATNAQESAILQEIKSAENLENSTEILELAKIQNKCFSTSSVNTANEDNTGEPRNTSAGINNINEVNTTEKESTDKDFQLENETINPRSELSNLKSEIKEALKTHSQILEEKINDKALQFEKEVTSSRSDLSKLKSEITEAFSNNSRILKRRINNKALQFKKEITSSRSELSDLKSEIKEVVNSLKSIETFLADKLDRCDHDKSLSENNVNKTNIIMGENVSQNITNVEEINAQELDSVQEKNLAENFENSTTILELAKVQDKCISTSFVNTANILKLKEAHEQLKTENIASFELILKGQEELNLKIATFLKQNCKSKIDGNPPGEISSRKQIYAISNCNGINNGKNIYVNVDKMHQSNYKAETNIEVKIDDEIEAVAGKEIEQANSKSEVDIAPSETISSRKPFNTTEQVNYRREIEKINLEHEANIKVKINDEKEAEQVNYKKEIEQISFENEADLEIKIDNVSFEEISSGEQVYEKSNISEINTKEIEQVDIKTEVDIAPSETISSRKPFNTTEQVNHRKKIEKINLEHEANIKVKINNEKEIEQISLEKEADFEVKIDNESFEEISSGEQVYENSNISEMNTKEIEQVDIKAKVDITPSETISSRKPFNS